MMTSSASLMTTSTTEPTIAFAIGVVATMTVFAVIMVAPPALVKYERGGGVREIERERERERSDEELHSLFEIYTATSYALP